MDPTHTGSFADVELAHASDYGGNPEGINMSTTAIIVLCDRAIPIGITLSLVPLLHSSWAGQVSLLVYPAILLIDLTLIVSTLPGPGRRD